MFIISYHQFFFLVFLLIALKKLIGSKSGAKPWKEKEKILYPLTSSILSYIRMITIIILVLIIILYPHHYLLMKWNGCISLYIQSTHELDFIFVFILFFSFLEREEPEWCLECQGRVCHKDIIALENGHLLPFKSHVCEWEASVCVRNWKMPISGSLIPFWSFWKVFLFFITGVFTVQIVFMKN